MIPFSPPIFFHSKSGTASGPHSFHRACCCFITSFHIQPTTQPSPPPPNPICPDTAISTLPLGGYQPSPSALKGERVEQHHGSRTQRFGHDMKRGEEPDWFMVRYPYDLAYSLFFTHRIHATYCIFTYMTG